MLVLAINFALAIHAFTTMVLHLYLASGLGVLDVLTPEIRRVLLWAFRFETQEAVRAEACHSIVALRMRGPDIVDVMHDRNLVEKGELVRKYVAFVHDMYI